MSDERTAPILQHIRKLAESQTTAPRSLLEQAIEHQQAALRLSRDSKDYRRARD